MSRARTSTAMTAVVVCISLVCPLPLGARRDSWIDPKQAKLQAKVDTAAASNNLRRVQKLVRTDGDSIHVACPAAYAYKHQNLEMLDLLLTKTSDYRGFFCWSLPYEDSITQQAIRAGDLKTLVMIRAREKRSLDACDLYYARKMAQSAIVNHILSSSHERLADSCTEIGMPPLAYYETADRDFFNRLLAAGVPLEPVLHDDSRAHLQKGPTALSSAVERRDLALVRELIRAGAKVNVEIHFTESLFGLNDYDTVGETPLCIGARIGDDAVVRELLVAGAYVNVLCGRRKVREADWYRKVQVVGTPLAIAEEHNHQGVVALLRSHGAWKGSVAEGLRLTSAGCQIQLLGEGMKRYPDWDVSWSGPCPGGVADGKGMLQWYWRGEKRHSYEGEMSNGYLHGRGRLIENGELLVGTFVSGFPLGDAYIMDREGRWRRFRFNKYLMKPTELPMDRGMERGTSANEEEIAKGIAIGLGLLALKWLGDVISAPAGGMDATGDRSMASRPVEQEGRAPSVGADLADTARPSNLVIRGWVFCRGNYYRNENLLVYVNNVGWTTEGVIRTDRSGRFELATGYTSGFREKRFKFVGECGETEFGTSRSTESTSIHLH